VNDRLARTVVLVDQHPLWLEAVEPIVTGLGMSVVGKTSSTTDALELIEAHRCDVLITGITMPSGEMTGIELIAAAMAAVPTLRAIVLTRVTEPRLIDEALRAGAVAYVIKTALADDLRSAVRQAFSHSIYLPAVTEQTVKFHLSNIYRKLEVANRTEASRWAAVHGLLPDQPRDTTSAA